VVIEHSFITTLGPDETMDRARAFLESRGFVADTRAGFALGPTQRDRLEMRRGKAKLRQAKSVSQLPQAAQIHWDRGRVDVGLSIEPSAVWGGNTFMQMNIGLTSNSAVVGNPKKMQMHTDLLMAIANGLEAVIVEGQPTDMAAAAWDNVERTIAEAARRRRRRNMITVIVLVLIIVAVIAIPIILLANR
jgi:uncharacterized membrane protein YidH (DUF202 family)